MLYWWRAKRWVSKWWPACVAAIVACMVALRLRRRRLTDAAREVDHSELEWQRKRDEAHVAEAVREGLLARADEAAKRARQAERDADAVESRRLAEHDRINNLSATALSAELRRLSAARKARRGLRIVLVGALTLASTHADAQDARPMVGVDGTHGWWISDAELRELVADSSAYHLCLAEGESLRLTLQYSAHETVSLRQSVDVLHSAHASAITRAMDAESGLAAERKKSRVWWRRPGVWLGIGVALGAGGVTALAVSL
jgi:hypothetical protein